MIKDLIIRKHFAAIGFASVFLLGGLSPAIAADEEPGSTGSSAIDALKQDFENFGKILGYDFTAPPHVMPNTDIDKTAIMSLQKNAIDLLLGIIPGKSIVAPDPDNLNSKINTLFKSQGEGALALEGSHLIDQKAVKQPASGGTSSSESDTVAYPTDPISQTIVNMLGTPAYGICKVITSADNTKSNNASAVNCSASKPVYQEAIALKVIGSLPKPNDIYSINTTLVNQLNSNTLIAPLIYSTANTSSNANPSSPPSGLPANNQAQEAENFIRYASSAVTPPTQLSADAFNALYTQATPQNWTASNTHAALSATATLSSYFLNMRTFAAQISVGTGNLYQMLAKRMPQQSVGDGAAATTTSEAYNEYVMATKRLYNPAPSGGGTGGAAKTPNQQWVDEINNASPATVQKEIAILLAEINYQLYLSRQQDERLLLTNTAMLFQLSHMVIPAPPPAPTPASASPGG